MTDETGRRDSEIRLRKDIDVEQALHAAQTVIARLQEEVERLGHALETQRDRYERTLADARDERRAVISTRGDRFHRLIGEMATLQEENDRLVAERDAAKWAQRRSAAAIKSLREKQEHTGHAYRASLRALRESFERQLGAA